MEKQCALYVGLVDFTDPTLLLLGEPCSFDWLANRIVERRTIELKCVLGKKIDSLVLVPVENEGYLLQMGSTLKWNMLESEANVVIQQLRELAVSASPAHAYLDTLNNRRFQP